MGEQDFKRWNHYVCTVCHRVTVAWHEDPGVTPYQLRCRATSTCRDWAMSLSYRCSQDDTQEPDVIFFRPKTEADLEKALAHMPERGRRLMLEHYRQGGCLMRMTRPT